MPASPRAAAIGIGSAIAVAISIPILAGLLATFAVKDLQERGEVVDRFEQTLKEIRTFGLENDRFPQAEDSAFWSKLPADVAVIDGEYTVFGDAFPLHRLPKVVVAVVQSRAASESRVVALQQFDQPGSLGDLLGSSKGIGIAIGLTSGEVLVVRDEMPLRDLRPFLTRNTAVRTDRKRFLDPYRLQLE